MSSDNEKLDRIIELLEEIRDAMPVCDQYGYIKVSE